jgi:hypothetical protein
MTWDGIVFPVRVHLFVPSPKRVCAYRDSSVTRATGQAATRLLISIHHLVRAWSFIPTPYIHLQRVA